MIATAMVAWSLFCGLTAAAVGLASLLAVRVLFGMSEGPLPSAQNKFISYWFPRGEQARALGVALAGAPLGGVIAAPLFRYIALQYGWRASFVVAALIGLVVAAIWLLTTMEWSHGTARPSALPRFELGAQMPLGVPDGSSASLASVIR